MSKFRIPLALDIATQATFECDKSSNLIYIKASSSTYFSHDFVVVAADHPSSTHKPTNLLFFFYFFFQHKNGHIVNDSDYLGHWNINTHIVWYIVFYVYIMFLLILKHTRVLVVFFLLLLLLFCFTICYFGWNVVRSLNFAIEKSLQNISYCLIVHIANIVINTFE